MNIIKLISKLYHLERFTTLKTVINQEKILFLIITRL